MLSLLIRDVLAEVKAGANPVREEQPAERLRCVYIWREEYGWRNRRRASKSIQTTETISGRQAVIGSQLVGYARRQQQGRAHGESLGPGASVRRIVQRIQPCSLNRRR